MPTPHPPHSPNGMRLPSPNGMRLRRGLSIAMSAAMIALCLLVLAVLILEPHISSDGLEPQAALLRLYEKTWQSWGIPPLVSLALLLGLPRRGELPALPWVLGLVALGLVILCVMMPPVMGEPALFPAS
ncbi:hypothetical protein [Microbacterium sp. SD291]|uniref:hypothetical protein n=1 Tax=Microbacterium sp. SD291 TaxID=2782007 RepID=UPI001A96E6D4|nr:hypothetical protein [Microbacterium sp. SD291]MBO0980475.1 hypothetical protein [Microbacterium sp. SD291]